MAKGDCPYCRQPGAVRVLWKVRCPNGACPKYDPALSRSGYRSGSPSGRSKPAGADREPEKERGVGSRPFFGFLLILAGIIVFFKVRGVVGALLGGWLAVRGWGMLNVRKPTGESADREPVDGPEDVEEEEKSIEWESGTLDGYSEKRDEPPPSVEERLDRQDRAQEAEQSRQERKRDDNDRDSRRGY